MTLRLSNLTVFVLNSPSSAVVAQRLESQGAVTVVGEASSFLNDANPARFALAVIPGDVASAMVEQVIDHASEWGIPVDDQRGQDVDQQFRGGQGIVTLVGGGPGHPDLITIAGARALAEADVILTDHLGPYSLAEEAARNGAEIIDVSKLPYGKQVAQERTNAMLVEKATMGKNVVRLKGGDSFIFGRGYEEWAELAAAGIPVRVIPGVTSATSAPAVAGFSLTHRGLNHDVTLVSGHVPPGNPKSTTNWEALAQMTGSLILIMAVKNAAAIAEVLMETKGGRAPSTPVAIVESASMSEQRVTTCDLGELAEVVEREGVKPPAIFVIGEAAGKRMELA
ncbi:uroporphyrinogen-III C-methyltransferase [Corynebacterium anserum]|uniref:uroporphyrinogen-III C-methyltransferase n=1 Tax=Corynebacterium anserum TaxID=2684406 RepID=A0A7G7YNT8_9CORY|nr:uroporphyrinogen-III C-methyltransferase [Corynebacterium anserum]MBC2681750.1 uroporphyrinogen-III C-methyltransferase [Corynebacterium anserum]QNH96158.1 uroporphyrinogen-III C-methyltransferase [Corynebacterium anserum]